MSEEFYVRSALSVTYFFGQFAFTICRSTLVDMHLISSYAVINFAVAALSWVLLLVLNKIYMSPATPPISFKYRLLGGFLQVITFLSTTIGAQNSSSIQFTSSILSIPCGLIYLFFAKKDRMQVQTICSLTLFFFGSVCISISNPITSLKELLISAVIAIPNTIQVFLTEYIMHESGVSAMSYQEAISGPRTTIATIVSAAMIMKEPELEINISPRFFVICLLFAAVACDMVCMASQASLISRTNALSFLMTKQFCQILFVLLGNTLNPTRFSTFSEALFSFIGFSLALPAQLLFVTLGNQDIVKRDDTEPFRLSSSSSDEAIEDGGE